VSEQLDQWIDKQTVSRPSVSLSIVIPAYNERWRLPTTLIDIVDYFDQRPQRTYEVIVVDDGSKDETDLVVRKFEKVRTCIRLLRLPNNQGKGFAVKMGALNATGQRVIFLDADGATPIAEIERLDRALDNGADIAIGSRAKKSEQTSISTLWYRKLLGRVFNGAVNFILLPGIEDTQCGFKMFTAEAASKVFKLQTSKGFSFDVEILFIARKLKLKIVEEAINWQNVPGSKVNLILDSLKMFKDIIKFRFIHRNI
jgi:dolichyl-phosphate beta-glucosyltransferase